MKRLLLINALVWASLILTASWLFKDVEGYYYFFLLLCFMAALMNGLIYKYSGPKRKSACR